jgi:hypothetical protein
MKKLILLSVFALMIAPVFSKQYVYVPKYAKIDSTFYEKHGVLLAPSPGWSVRLYGFPPEGIGDCISRMNATRDKKYIPLSKQLLMARKRWPDVFQEQYGEYIAKNRIEWKWEHLKWWMSKDENGKTSRLRKYGPQTRMSRDPFIYYISNCAEYPEQIQDIKDVSIPWYLYRGKTWAWRKYLITEDPKKKERYKRRYVRKESRSLNFPMKEFVHNLVLARCEVVQDWDLWVKAQEYDKVKPNK